MKYYPQPNKQNNFPNCPNIVREPEKSQIDISRHLVQNDEEIEGFAAKDGAIYLCSQKQPAQDSNNEDFHGESDGILRKLSTNEGDIIWEFNSDTMLMGPTLAGDSVYVSQHHGNKLYSIDVDSGDINWVFDAGQSYGLFLPAVSDDTVFVSKIARRRLLPGFTGSVYAIDASSGGKEWEADQGIGHTLTVGDQLVYGVSSGGSIVGLDQGTGETQWEFEHPESPNGSVVVFSRNNLYTRISTKIVSIDVQSRQIEWEFDIKNNSVGTPSVSDDSVFVGVTKSNSNDGIYCLSRDSGRVQWSTPLKDTINGQPIITNNTVYVKTEDGSFYSICRNGGSINFSLKLEKVFGVLVQPSFDTDSIYCVSDNYITVLNQRKKSSTKVYSRSASPESPSNKKSRLAYCPKCGGSLELYTNPSYCPNCGCSL